MPGKFNESGIHFQYPENWKLEREQNDDGFTITLQSPGTAFFMFCLREDSPAPAEMADTALEALREDYPQLEADDRTETFAGQMALGHDIQFFSLDLVNTCWTRCFMSPQGTVLVLCQTSDIESAGNEPVLRAICASMKVDED